MFPGDTKKKKTIPKVVKDLTWQRWIGDDIAKAKCLCCGVNEIKMNSFHCGHVISEAMGGPTTVDNLRPVCATCNLSMRTQHMEKFKGQHGLGQIASSNPLTLTANNIIASATIGTTLLSVSVPVSEVIKVVNNASKIFFT
jgi:esterase/lipase